MTILHMILVIHYYILIYIQNSTQMYLIIIGSLYTNIFIFIIMNFMKK